MRGLAAGAAVLLSLSACTGIVGSEWDGSWRDREGREVPEDVISTHNGPTHCDWESAVFLQVGWPLGERRSPGRYRMYVRDPDGLFREELRVPFDPEVELPRTARYTGYHRDNAELWISPADADEAVYVVRDGRAERWPRPWKPFGCA